MDNPIFTPHTQLGSAPQIDAKKIVEDKLFQYLKQVERGEGLAPADSALNQMERNEKRRRDHDVNLLSSMKNIMNDKDLQVHQRKALIASKDHTEYIIEPNKLDPLISVYEKSNKSLKLENATLRNDTTRLCDALEVLIKDNAKLREFITKKNEDMGKTLTTLSQEEGEYIVGLKDNVEILEEENKHLLFKVQQLEELLKREKDEHEDDLRVLNLGKNDKRRLKEDLDEHKLRDKANTEKILLLKDKIGEFEKLYEKEKSEKEILKKELEKIKHNENERLNRKLDDLDFKENKEDYNELSQEVVFLREENEFLKEKLRVHMNGLKNVDLREKKTSKSPSKEKDILKINSEKIKKLEEERNNFENMYNKTLKKLRILQSIESDIQKPSIFNDPNTNQLPNLKDQLRKKNNELQAEKKQNQDYIKEMEKVNNEILRKISKDNENLKKEKNELLIKVNQMLAKNVKTNQRLDLAEVYLESDAANARIKSLEEDNQRLRKKLSDLRQNGDKDIDLGENVLKLKNQMLKNDKEYKDATKKLYDDLKRLEGERINQQHHIEKQNTAIKNMYTKFEKVTKDKFILSKYIEKLHQSLKENDKEKPWNIPDLIKSHMDSERSVGETPRSQKSEMSKNALQAQLRRSHHEDDNNSKKDENKSVRFAEEVEEKLIEKTTNANIPREIRRYKLPDGRIVDEEEYQRYLQSLNIKQPEEAQRPASVPRPVNQPIIITEEGVNPVRHLERDHNHGHFQPPPRPVTHSGNFYSPRKAPPPLRPQRRRYSHSNIVDPRLRSESPERVLRPHHPHMELDPYRDAREIVSSAYDRTVGEYRRDPMMDTMSSQLTYGMRSVPRVRGFGYEGDDSIRGGINDLIRRYNETDMYDKV